MVNALDLRVARQSHRIKTHATHVGEAGLQSAQAFQGGAWFDELVALQHSKANLIEHRHDRAVEFAKALCGSSTLLRGECELIHIFTAPTRHGGN